MVVLFGASRGKFNVDQLSQRIAQKGNVQTIVSKNVALDSLQVRTMPISQREVYG